MPKDKKMWDNILTVIMSLLCLLWIYPIVLILLNSLKIEGTFTTSTVFQLPTAETFAGLSNYIYGVTKMGFLSSLGYSLVITVSSVALILLCCSMTGWYLTRVNNKLSKFMNLLIVFSMVVPFQMVMFTLSKTADTLNLNTPWNICIIYLGFGAGLAVFMFTGFMKSVPIEIEEAAMIDGCNPIQIFFKIVFPILKPTMISTAILETMWVWNDYLLPTLVLDIKKYRTIPMAIQYFRGLWPRRAGPHDGLHHHRHHPHHHPLHDLPEVHHRGCRGRRCQGLKQGGSSHACKRHSDARLQPAGSLRHRHAGR